MDNSQIENTINEIRKRNGTVTTFDLDKISNFFHSKFIQTSILTNVGILLWTIHK